MRHEFTPAVDNHRRIKIRNYMVAPLKNNEGRVVGIVQLSN
jgi:hypothetical protein